MSEVKLKPCPFCGCEEIRVEYEMVSDDFLYAPIPRWRVQCCNCSALICRGEKRNAIEAWNRRAE